MSRNRTLVAAATAFALTGVVSGCTATRDAAGHGPSPHPPPASPGAQRVTQARVLPHLAAFSDCEQLLHTVKQQALDQVTAYGLTGVNGPIFGAERDALAGAAVAMPAPMAAAAGTTTGTGAGDTGFSGTNDQVAGVDEPDLAKTDGHLLVVVRNDPVGLEILRVDGTAPEKLAFFNLGNQLVSPQIFLAGSSVVAIGTEWDNRASDSYEPKTEAVVVSLDDASHPVVARTFSVDGSEVDARYVDGQVLLVVQSQPALPMRYAPSASAVTQVLRDNRATVARSSLKQWLPAVTATPSGTTTTSDCSDTWHSVGAKDEALSTVSVVSFDPASESSVHETTVFGSATVVYASTDALYLATPGDGGYTGPPVAMPAFGPMGTSGGVALAGPIRPVAFDGNTHIHEFDISDPAKPRYVGSGVVRGTLIDQYSLGDSDGYLRVATTVGTPVPAPGEGEAPRIASDNRVTVLHDQDGALVQVGQVRGLGRGEKIYGVRFVGAIGYVVTFRQVDPLYVLDLADPRHPRALGHLEVTGYSSYLHPLGDGLLLGLGRTVDARAATNGEQLSVFDVNDPARPALLSRLRMLGAYSAAQDDHHAFLWWPAQRLVVVPIQSYDGGPVNGGSDETVFHVDAAGVLSRVGAVAPPASADNSFGGPERTLVIGGLLYTVGEGGVLANDLHSLDRVAWLPFH